MSNNNSNGKTQQNSRAEDLKEELTANIKLLESDMASTQKSYEEELTSFATRFGEDLESRSAKKEMKKIAQKYAEKFADQNEQMENIERLLAELDNANYTE